MSDEVLLTTTQAAQALGVGVSSLKRWADLNVIPCLKTAGGHRRFRQTDVEGLLNRRQQAPDLHQLGIAARLVERMLDGSSYHLQAEMMAARGELGSWHAVSSEVGTSLRLLGERWANGEVSIIEEHIASEKLARALQTICEALPSPAGAHQCLLATAEDDDHTLGLSLTELCLREAGWRTLWAGRGTPSSEIIAKLASGEIQLVALSASVMCNNAVALARQAELIGRAAHDKGALLVLGGTGLWPERPRYGIRLHDFSQLHGLSNLLSTSPLTPIPALTRT